MEPRGLYVYIQFVINFKEEIDAETVYVIPHTKLIEKVSQVSKISSLKPIEKDREYDSESYASCYEQECQKLAKVKEHKESDSSEIKQGVMNGMMNYYNKNAKEAYFLMTFSNTDLKC